MRVIVVDTDVAFTSKISQRFKQAGVNHQIFPQIAAAMAEIKKDPDGVDLILIAKELTGGQDGLAMAQLIRKDGKTADVPYLIMSSAWGKPDFAKHQKTEFGANAYYSKKNPTPELEATIEAVTGFKFPPAPAVPTPPKKDTTSILNVQLQVASDIVNIAEDVPGGISMEEPINLFADEEPNEALAALSAAPPVPIIPQRGATKAGPAAEAAEPAEPTEPVPVVEAPVAPVVADEPLVVEAAEPVAVLPPEPPSIGTPSEPSLQLEAGTVPGKAPVSNNSEPVVSSSPDSGGGISIDVTSEGMEFQLETSKKPEVSAPAPVAASAPVAKVEKELTKSGPLEISLTGEMQAYEMPAQAAAPVSTAAPMAEVALEAAPAVAPVEVEAAVAPAATQSATPMAVPVSTGAENQSFTIAGTIAGEVGVSQTTGESAVSEEEAARDLPYLFAGNAGTRKIVMPPSPSAASFSEVPAGGPLSNDVETLKKYLTMREQDVSVLSAQLSYAKEELGKGEEAIKRLTLQGEDLFHQIDDLKKKIEGQAQELEHANRNREGELEQLRFEVKSKIDRIKFLEDRLNDSAQQYEKLKERVRLDIRKIRVREKELESKLEILKKDSETLIAARENKILELKRKIDLLEFNYDTLQDKNEAERANVRKGEEKIERIHKVLKLALGVIEAENEQGEQKASASEPGVKVAS